MFKMGSIWNMKMLKIKDNDDYDENHLVSALAFDFATHPPTPLQLIKWRNLSPHFFAFRTFLKEEIKKNNTITDGGSTAPLYC